MIHARVIARPADLTPEDLTGRTVVVLDVLRATTTMTTALAAGATEIRVFDNIDAARSAAAEFTGLKILCGEVKAVRPPGFDLGNSPDEFRRDLVAGKTMFMSTTNGTRAIVAAKNAAVLLVGAIVNAQSVAARVLAAANDLTLLCSGTEGKISLEDTLGAGAILHAGQFQIDGDFAQLAVSAFQASQHDLPAAFRFGAGAHNLRRANLEKDIPVCAALNSLSAVGIVRDVSGYLIVSL